MSDIPPEVLFHRYFQTPTSPRDYRGKLDIETQPLNVRAALADIQNSHNKAFSEEKNDRNHANHSPFHFDYIDSSCENALAFRYEGYSFIGITVGLIRRVSETCIYLSRSQRVATHLRVQPTPEGRDALRTVLFRIMINFVVSHEYAHHLHGDVCQRDSESTFINEILCNDDSRHLDQQTLELDADAHSAMVVLANLIERGERWRAIKLLQLEAEPAGDQDEVLYSSFVVAVGGYLFVRPPTALQRQGIYKLTHPPQSMRMNFLMQAADSWCRQKRSALLERMTSDRFDLLMTSAAEVAWGMNGGRDWAAQVAFILSEDGTEYRARLHESLKRRFTGRPWQP
jgi:hypothetical protein